MKQTKNDFRPESPQTEPAPPLPALPAPPGEIPHFATQPETGAFWQGVSFGLAANEAAAAADGASLSPRVRRIRVDGFTGPKQAVFLEAIAAGLTVEEAAARAEISVTTIYNFRNRRAGRAFNIAWEAASRRARRPLADHLHDRSLRGQTDTLRDKEGEVVGTRHRHDNRLAMAILTRLDRKAEACREDEALVTIVAEEFEELLDIIEAGGDAEDFIECRRPQPFDYGHREREPRPMENILNDWHVRHRYDMVDPAAIDTSDLEPAECDRWTDDQWARACRSGLIPPGDDEETGDG
jgi:hypothetical protein